MHDYYKILGVERTASASVIKKTFYRRAREVHPDVNNSPEAEAEFKRLNEAYAVLIDPQKRQNYDRFGDPRGPFATGQSPFNGLEDLFQDLFGFGARQTQGGTGASRNVDANIYLTQTLTPKQQIYGADIEITYENKVACEACEGTGSKSKHTRSTCPTCGGSGREAQVAQTIFGTMQIEQVCSTCGGAGTILKDPCAVCNGSGTSTTTVTETISVEAGINPAEPYILHGKGNPSTSHQGPGDVIISFDLTLPEPFVATRQGVAAPYEVDVLSLIAGAELELPSLIENETFTYTLSPFNTDHTLITLEHAGLARPDGSRSPLLFELIARYPKDLSQHALEELARIRDKEAR